MTGQAKAKGKTELGSREDPRSKGEDKGKEKENMRNHANFIPQGEHLSGGGINQRLRLIHQKPT